MDSLDLSKKLNGFEAIGRILFDPNSMSENGDEVSPAAFLLRDLRTPETYLSVFRTMYMSLTMDFAQSLIKKVPENNTICGYAHLTVEEIHDYDIGKTQMAVLPYPSKHILYHAGIHIIHDGISFAGSGDCQHPCYIKASEYLAKMSDLKIFR